MAKAEEKYFVCSMGDAPHRIVFSKLEALATEYQYIDSFNAEGKPVESYKFQDDATYTTDF